MSARKSRPLWAWAVLGLLVGGVAGAQGATEAGRAIMDQHKEAVVTLQLVINQQFSMPGMGSRREESRSEVTGTVIDSSGLTLVSLSETDPGSLIRSMMGGTEGFQFETEVTDMRMIMADGSEIPAMIVLRDPDLDIAFVRPAQPRDTPFTHVDLSQSSTAQILDEVIIISRLGRVANRAYGAAVDRIQAIVERPRTFYIPVGVDPAGNLGSPAFTLDGRVLGIALLRTMQGDGGSLSRMQGGGGNSAVIVVPSEDIVEAAAEAPSVEEAAQRQAAERQAEDEAPAPEDEGDAPEDGDEAPENGNGGGAQPSPAPAPVPSEPSPA